MLSTARVLSRLPVCLASGWSGHAFRCEVNHACAIATPMTGECGKQFFFSSCNCFISLVIFILLSRSIIFLSISPFKRMRNAVYPFGIELVLVQTVNDPHIHTYIWARPIYINIYNTILTQKQPFYTPSFHLLNATASIQVYCCLSFKPLHPASI